MNFIFKAFLMLFYFIQAQGLHAEGKLIFGSDLKKVAAERLAEEGISKTVLVSDKRAYFPCAKKIYISPKNTVGGFVTGDYGSDIDISVVHPDAIGIQNPYEDLNYGSLPESP